MRIKALLIPAALAVAMILLSLTPFSWTGWRFEYCGVQNCYCEPFRDQSFVRQPFTATSNLGYLLAGGLVLQGSRRAPYQAGIIQSRGWYGAALLLAGAFSFFSHASLTRLGEWLDLMGVYLIEATLLALSLANITGRSQGWQSGLFAGILLLGGAQMAVAPHLQMLVIASLLAALVASEILTRVKGQSHGPNRYLLLGVGLYALGALVWGITSRQGGCLGGSFPGHTLWHLLSAGAIGTLYAYYFSRE